MSVLDPSMNASPGGHSATARGRLPLVASDGRAGRSRHQPVPAPDSGSGF
jgi:hypothetical protein